jgi:predicted nucleotidyltransferase component of viral defense system
MKRSERRNSAESIRARLLDLARARREDFQLTLSQYAIERFLYRLGQSGFHDQFVLKGAMLFVLWEGHLHRPTRDLDFLGYGSPDLETIAGIFRQVAAIEAGDGIAFAMTDLRVERIKEDADYEGVRLSLLARLAGARIPMQVDVGFGDAASPVTATFPVLLPLDPPQIQVYQRETVIAEKFQAMVALDLRNSRMKDFFDLWAISRTWFLRRLRLQDETPDLHVVGRELREFLKPVVSPDAPPVLTWPPGGPWRI